MKQPDVTDYFRRPPYIKQVKRNWMQRNPRVFHLIGVTLALSILFSRPLYDIFINDTPPMTVEELRKLK